MKLLVLMMVIVSLVGTASASYGMSRDPVISTIDRGETQIFTVEIVDAPDAMNTFSVIDAEGFKVLIDGVETNSVDWSGTANTFIVEVTNEDAPNGEYEVTFRNDNYVAGTTSVYVQLNVIITAIPEFPTVALPIAAILGLAFFMQRRKEE
jgi:hypothetical protein